MSVLMKRFKADIKLILRERIMVFIMFAPLLIMTLFKIGVPLLNEILIRELSFDLSPYYIYITAMAIILSPFLLATLAGFLILDEKDQNLFPLMKITPAGMSGYYFGRLFLPSLVSFIYCIFAVYFICLNRIPFHCMVFCAIITILETVMIALFLGAFAKDKVQGMTYAKGLGILMFPMFFELFNNEALNFVSYITPFYWVKKAIEEPVFLNYIIGFVVHVIWLGIVIYLNKIREKA